MSENNEKKTHLVPAVCTQCGGQLEVDPQQQAAVCPYCGTPFIVEKAINNYNITHVHQNNTIHVQHGKKGIIQSMTDLADKQLEREQNARIRAAELELEQQKLNMIREEKKKAARKSFWKKVPWVLGWIYCFPIPAGILIFRNPKLDQRKKMIYTGICAAAYILILLFARGSSSADTRPSSRPSQTSAPAVQEKTPEPEPTPAYSENAKQSKDFDTLDHKTLTVGDYTFEIPAWNVNDDGDVYYPGDGQTDKVLFTYTKSSKGGFDEDSLARQHENIIANLMETLGLKDYVIINDDSLRINGIKMDSVVLHTGESVKIPWFIRTVWFLNPSDGSIISMIMLEQEASPAGYKNDFSKIINTIRLAETESSGSGMSFEEFKQKMDAYEQFFDTYVEFMKSYDATDTSLLGEYMQLLEDYEKAMQALDDIGESELTPEQDAYYTEVLARINKKLLEVVNY